MPYPEEELWNLKSAHFQVTTSKSQNNKNKCMEQIWNTTLYNYVCSLQDFRKNKLYETGSDQI